MEISFFYRNIWGCFGGTDLIVEHNLLHDARSEHNVYTCNNVGNTGHQVGTIVQDNVMYSARWNNVHINANFCDGCIIRRNILSSSNDTGSGNANIAIQSGFANGIIENNVLFNFSGYGLLFNTYKDTQTGIGVPSDMTGNYIANNTILDTGRDMVGHNFGGQCFQPISIQNTNDTVDTVDLGHNFYYNNIIVRDAGSSCTAAVAYKQINSTDIDWWTTDTWKNNIIYTPDGSAPLTIVPAGGTISAGKRTWGQFGTDVAVFTGNSQSNPLFVHYTGSEYASPLLFNLRLQGGSPAIGAGTTGTGVPSVDVLGNARANPPAMGAFEP